VHLRGPCKVAASGSHRPGDVALVGTVEDNYTPQRALGWVSGHILSPGAEQLAGRLVEEGRLRKSKGAQKVKVRWFAVGMSTAGGCAAALDTLDRQAGR
jgi:hypothetical protein